MKKNFHELRVAVKVINAKIKDGYTITHQELQTLMDHAGMMQTIESRVMYVLGERDLEIEEE
ncbi:hypothetical protein [Bacillus sp. OTU530]|uniref:hypothetical protein n=1 Tax=Bacillus sp. OTU530 TaxID=3043862 RepID=UPI00313BA956